MAMNPPRFATHRAVTKYTKYRKYNLSDTPTFVFRHALFNNSLSPYYHFFTCRFCLYTPHKRKPHIPETPTDNSTRVSRWIQAPPEALYRAFTDPAALPRWLVPGEMTGVVHQFDGRVGGGYEMSLYYPESEPSAQGKSAPREDRYRARFLELTPPRRIVTAITFDAADPAFAGEMRMEATLDAQAGGTLVTIAFYDLPAGIRPEDNETGTRESLAKLAEYVEEGIS